VHGISMNLKDNDENAQDSFLINRAFDSNEMFENAVHKTEHDDS
jgi:hypothetical protein